jgi:hypothetical protein
MSVCRAHAKSLSSPTKDGTTPKPKGGRRRADPADPQFEKEESDYSDVSLPWGPDW